MTLVNLDHASIGKAGAGSGVRQHRFRRIAEIMPLMPAGLFLATFFALPLIFVVGTSFFTPEGALTLQNYLRLVNVTVYWRILVNTLQIAFWTATLAILMGYPLAAALSSRRHSGKGFFMMWIMIPLWTSFLVRALAWMLILSRNGVINSTMMSLGLFDSPVRMVNNYPAVLLAMVHGMMPIAVLTMNSVMQNIDPSLTRAASTLGAKPGHVFWRVYFPLSLPGVASAWLVVFVSALGTFIIPVLVGSPKEMMIAGAIVEQINNNFDWGFAGALTMMLLAATLIVYFVFDQTLGRSVFASGSGQGSASHKPSWIQRKLRPIGTNILVVVANITTIVGRLLPTGAGRPANRESRSLTVASWILVAFLALPTIFVVPVAFSEDRFFSWPPVGFTLRWFDAYFGSEVWMTSTWNSLYIALLTAVVSMLLGVPSALVLARKNIRFRAAIMMLVVSPMILPNIVIAVGLFYIFAHIGVVGSIWAIVIGHTVLSLPYVIITVMAVLKNYDVRLDHAAWTLGAGRLKTFRLVTMPILRAGIAAAFLFSFVRSFDDLSIALFLGAGQLSTLPLQLWSSAQFGIDSTLAAVSTVIFTVVCIMVVVATRFGSAKK